MNTPVAVIRPQEVVNEAECDMFAAELKSAIKDGAEVVIIDCTDVRYMNSRAVGSIIETFTVLSGVGGVVKLVAPGDAVRRCLETVGILPLLEIYASMDEAEAGQ